jgi:uncharacterized protein (DUF2141 family)
MRKLFVCVLFTLISSAATYLLAEESTTGTISGTLLIKAGAPLANGVVFIFNDASGPPPAIDKYWRVPDETITTDAAGSFVAKLPAGKYYLGAVQRKSGDEVGPLREGDLFLPINANGVPRQISVKRGETTELGIVSGAAPYRKAAPAANEVITAIEGNITGPNNMPVENALVFAFLSPAMIGKPLFISEKTGKDGKYSLRVSQGDTYYLKIRNFYGGGAMRTGEIMGSYGAGNPAPVSVKTGTIVKGINISASNFPGQGVKSP